jgi:hypothetical protein
MLFWSINSEKAVTDFRKDVSACSCPGYPRLQPGGASGLAYGGEANSSPDTPGFSRAEPQV